MPNELAATTESLDSHGLSEYQKEFANEILLFADSYKSLSEQMLNILQQDNNNYEGENKEQQKKPNQIHVWFPTDKENKPYSKDIGFDAASLEQAITDRDTYGDISKFYQQIADMQVPFPVGSSGMQSEIAIVPLQDGIPTGKSYMISPVYNWNNNEQHPDVNLNQAADGLRRGIETILDSSNTIKTVFSKQYANLKEARIEAQKTRNKLDKKPYHASLTAYDIKK